MIERRSALAAHALLQAAGRAGVVSGAPARVFLAQLPPMAILQVSAFAATADEAALRLAGALELALPEPNRYSGDSHKNLRALGPGIWQAVGCETALPHAAVLRQALAGLGTVVNLGHARSGWQMGGTAAARTLAKHCSLDLDARHFPTGSATNTRFGPVNMTIARTSDAPIFELLVARGYGEFVFETLVNAAAEYGLEITTS